MQLKREREKERERERMNTPLLLDNMDKFLASWKDAYFKGTKCTPVLSPVAINEISNLK